MRTVLAILLVCAPAAIAMDLRDVTITPSTHSNTHSKHHGGPRRTFFGGPGSSDPTHLVIRDYTLFQMILEVYGVDSLDVAYQHLSPSQRGALFRPNLDINAVVPAGVSDELFHEMLRSMLARHFGLAVHRGTLDVPVYRLHVSPTGIKIKPHSPDTPLPVRSEVNWDESPKFDGDTAVRRFQAVNLGMAEFAERIARLADRHVFDETHLSGKYDFPLTCGPMPFAQFFSACTQMLPGAVEQQLGLKLEAGKAPVKMLVIDDCRPPAYTIRRLSHQQSGL